MKKFICVSLALCMSIALIGCGEDEISKQPKKNVESKPAASEVVKPVKSTDTPKPTATCTPTPSPSPTPILTHKEKVEKGLEDYNTLDHFEAILKAQEMYFKDHNDDDYFFSELCAVDGIGYLLKFEKKDTLFYEAQITYIFIDENCNIVNAEWNTYYNGCMGFDSNVYTYNGEFVIGSSEVYGDATSIECYNVIRDGEFKLLTSNYLSYDVLENAYGEYEEKSICEYYSDLGYDKSSDYSKIKEALEKTYPIDGYYDAFRNTKILADYCDEVVYGSKAYTYKLLFDVDKDSNETICTFATVDNNEVYTYPVADDCLIFVAELDDTLEAVSDVYSYTYMYVDERYDEISELKTYDYERVTEGLGAPGSDCFVLYIKDGKIISIFAGEMYSFGLYHPDMYK